jgi:SAM-dependent methyltransferase
MAIMLHDAVVLKTICAKQKFSKVACFGVPELCFSDKNLALLVGENLEFKNLYDFWKCLGIDEVDYFDVSADEGANVIVDLNLPIHSKKYSNKYDLVLDYGVVQHVSCPFELLANVNRLLKVGGTVIHSTYANGFFDQGLFQVSPAFFYDNYVHSAGYECTFLSMSRIRRSKFLSLNSIIKNLYHEAQKRLSGQIAITGGFTKVRQVEKMTPGQHQIYSGVGLGYPQTSPIAFTETYFTYIRRAAVLMIVKILKRLAND